MQIDVQPWVMKDVILSIALDSYEKHVSSVVFTPTAAAVTWQGLTPEATYTDTSAATWACTLEYAQDWETVDSLSQYLMEHEGESVAVEFTPRAGSGPSFTATLIITPGAIGGPVNAFATATVTLGASGKPVLVPASPTPAWAATTAYDVGDRVTIASGTVRLRAVLAGTSGASAPATPATVGEGVEDGTVTWVRES